MARLISTGAPSTFSSVLLAALIVSGYLALAFACFRLILRERRARAPRPDHRASLGAKVGLHISPLVCHPDEDLPTSGLGRPEPPPRRRISPSIPEALIAASHPHDPDDVKS